MSAFIKRHLILMIFALVNSIVAFILLDYFILEMKVWQYIVIETTIVLMHVLIVWIKGKIEQHFPDEEGEEDLEF
jgi:hypothetical protein